MDEPPHYDSKRWTGDPELERQDHDRAMAVQAARGSIAQVGPPGLAYIGLLMSILLPMFAIWIVEGSTALVSPPVAKIQIEFWLGLILVAGLAGLVRQNALQLSIAKIGIVLMLVTSALNVIVGVAAWCMAVGEPPSRAVIVNVSYSRNNTTATMVLADGYAATMQWQNRRYRPMVDECVVTRKWAGPAGYAWIEVVGVAVSPATGEPLMTEDPRLCFAGERALPAQRTPHAPTQLAGLFLLLLMLVGSGLVYLFLVRAAARMVDRKSE
jgi:hypothetical protein